jgi:hypothetical protein
MGSLGPGRELRRRARALRPPRAQRPRTTDYTAARPADRLRRWGSRSTCTSPIAARTRRWPRALARCTRWPPASWTRREQCRISDGPDPSSRAPHACGFAVHVTCGHDDYALASRGGRGPPLIQPSWPSERYFLVATPEGWTSGRLRVTTAPSWMTARCYAQMASLTPSHCASEPRMAQCLTLGRSSAKQRGALDGARVRRRAGGSCRVTQGHGRRRSTNMDCAVPAAK